MIDNSTGAIHPLVFEQFKQAIPEMVFSPQEFEEELQKAKDAIQSNRELQGATFVKGEIIEIRGSKFKVNGFSRKRLYLDALPNL